jgi:serine protease Do
LGKQSKTLTEITQNQMRKKAMKRMTIPLTLTTAIVLAAFSFTTHAQDSTVQTEVQNGQEKRETIVDFRSLAKKAIPAVVSINVESKRNGFQSYGNGALEDPFGLFGNDLWRFFGIPNNGGSIPVSGQASGFIVRPDGYILTNSHVVNGVDKILVQLTDGREFEAKLLGEDPNSDIAVIKVDAADLPFLELGDSNALEVGQWVAAIGNPLGRNNLDITQLEDFIQTDASIYKGNSGGPLLNLEGQVVGINTAIATNTSSSYLGIGFAIPSNMARYVMDEIIAHGKVSRGYLGVTLQSIDYSLAQAFGLKKVEGALVTNVLKGSPADKAGLKAEDIILKYDNRSVENASSLRNAIYLMKPGTRIVLTVLRRDKVMEIPLEVGSFKEEKPEAKSIKTNKLGIEVETLSPEAAEKLGYKDDQGVVITKVDPRSPAAFAGLKKGALILSVNRKKVENVEQFEAALQEASKGHPLLLQIKQGEAYLFLSIKVD